MGNIGKEELTGAHDTEIPAEFVEYMTSGRREQETVLVPVPQLDRMAARRAALSNAFPGETLVVPTGRIQWRTFGGPYPFRGGSDLLWLTADQDPNSVLVMHPIAGGHDAVLYVDPRHDPASGVGYLDRILGEAWQGRCLSPEEKSTVLGVHTRPIGELPAALGRAGATVRVLRGYDATIDRGLLPATEENAARDALLASVLAELRLEKDDWELAQIQEAVDITVRGFEDVARQLPTDRAISERLIEGIFATRARHDGNGVGYSSIVAAGANSTILHWGRNDGVVRPDGIILMDMGAEARSCYTADVSRVLPASGTFTTAERDVYDIVYAAHQAGLAAMAPGVAFQDIDLACKRVQAEGLRDLGVMKCGVEEALEDKRQPYRRWTLCAFGHMLGLDVHDCGHARPEHYGQGVLRENQVLTMEPGLYLQPHDELVPEGLRGIGIRIEDDVRVTGDGVQVLSAALPAASREVESWLAAQREAGPRLPGHDGPAA
ncbi:aminopeptidase P family protein [Embleya sp. NBC_00896]|uniref:aminopeptidase P family protein n=1 Tax=Embleya sp. NBC_00896 TaxID=2975961 RepID=UPI003866E22B|nr:Xaa-Pro aminopeptidase [Embleya sp. NBC_00896]